MSLGEKSSGDRSADNSLENCYRRENFFSPLKIVPKFEEDPIRLGGGRTMGKRVQRRLGPPRNEALSRFRDMLAPLRVSRVKFPGL